MTPLILDGSNLCHEGQKKGGKFKTLGALLPCLRALLTHGIEAYVIFDASFRHRLEKSSRAAGEFETLLKKDDKFRMAPAGTPADAFILEFAALRDFGVLSNDTFRQYVERKGKGKEPHFNGKRIHLHSFQMLMGAFVIPSLRISYLIDPAELDVDDLIAARPQEAPPAQAAKAQSKAQPAKSEPAAKSRPATGSLDFLLELSPCLLRARDVFGIYRETSGKSWKAGNTRKTAAQFAGEVFASDVLYRDVEGRDRNDGYFLDPRYADGPYEDVRQHLLAKSPKMLPLASSARPRQLRLLELMHDESLAEGFNLQLLGERARSAGIPAYERYLRAMLCALIAVGNARGKDEAETDIAKILKGELHVTRGESQSEMLNALQRGMLYLMTDAANRLPDVIRANMSWLLQLPDKPVRDTIVQGHLAWLDSIASGESG